MCNFFDFNGDGKVDALEFMAATALDPNNPLNRTSDDDDKDEEEK